MTSSPGHLPAPYEAVIRNAGQNVGPIRLPETDAAQFIELFDRTYRSLGISIASLTRADAVLPNHSSTESR